MSISGRRSKIRSREQEWTRSSNVRRSSSWSRARADVRVRSWRGRGEWSFLKLEQK
jgi:hypothetical protein